jgi:mono/diheme cytochrome c family protein
MKLARMLCVLPFVAAVACHQKDRAPEAAVPGRGSVYELKMGKQAYQQYCVGCHGDAGQGDGFNSFNLDPHPRDLSDPVFQKGKSNAELADAIRRGGAGVGLSSLMPPWGKTLDARRIDAVVLYVRSLRHDVAPGPGGRAGL